LPSASVSTRTIVPFGTFAFAAASTFDAVSPVRSVSSLRWWPHGFCGSGTAEGAAATACVATPLELEEPEPEPLAALAIP